jgi:hypothetical protein
VRAQVVGSTYQILEAPNMSTYIGTGKVAEVARAVRAWRADTVIFDDELSPGQLRNLEKAFSGKDGKDGGDGKEGGAGVRVGDRTALILDIFSQRAATKEGKLQVGRVCGGGRGRWRRRREACCEEGLAQNGWSSWQGRIACVRSPAQHTALRTRHAHERAPLRPPPGRRWSWPRWSTSCRASHACGATWTGWGAAAW